VQEKWTIVNPASKGLGILRLDDLYKLHTACLVYDFLNGYAPAQLQGLFSYLADGAHTSTRSQTNKPPSFICKGHELWNNLSESFQASANKKALRSKLKESYLD
jgi:hypothetical protein